MKLYATATSERASKGQGGNKYLHIDLQAGDEREHIATVKLENGAGPHEFGLSVFVRGVLEFVRTITTKGE